MVKAALPKPNLLALSGGIHGTINSQRLIEACMKKTYGADSKHVPYSSVLSNV
ncbi:MAG: hypothetical protein LBQ98_02830 [Nitrososphaerota archaeon]|nr:hypothetical protein [Nitrososphaerota archaeon]